MFDIPEGAFRTGNHQETAMLEKQLDVKSHVITMLICVVINIKTVTFIQFFKIFLLL